MPSLAEIDAEIERRERLQAIDIEIAKRQQIGEEDAGRIDSRRDIADITGGGEGVYKAAPQSARLAQREALKAPKITSEASGLPEIGDAPELNEMTMAAFKTSLGLLTTGDTEKAKGVIQSQIPEAKFREDEDGFTIVDFPSGSFALNKPGVSGQDIVRMAFGIGAFTPAGRAAMLPAQAVTRVGMAGATAAGTEAGLQATTEVLGGGPIDTGEVAEAGMFGVGGQAFADLLGMGARLIRGRPSAEAEQLIRAGEEAGIPVMTTDILEPKGIIGGLARQAGERIPVFGTGAPRAAQQNVREQAAVEFANSLPRSTSLDIVNSLKAQTSKVKKAAGDRIEAVTTRMNDTGTVDISGTLNTIDNVIGELSKKGKIKDAATVAKLEETRDTLLEAPQTFGMLRENRTAIREFVNSTDPLIRSQLPSRSKVQLEKVYRSITSELDNQVLTKEGPQALAKYKKADAVYANEANKLTKSRLKNVLDKGDITPENVETMLLSKKPTEVKLLHDSLNAEGKAAARSALIQRAVEAAGGAEDLNPTLFSNQLKKVRANTFIFFKGEELKRLQGFTKLLNATKRAQEAPVVTPTGQSLLIMMGIGGGATAGVLPTLAAAATAGGAARLYESKPMRDMLLKLANTPANSEAFNRAINQYAPEIIAIAQAERREE